MHGQRNIKNSDVTFNIILLQRKIILDRMQCDLHLVSVVCEFIWHLA